MKSFVLGHTTNGLPIFAHRFENPKTDSREVLILGGVHGDEPEGITASMGLLESFMESFPFQCSVTLVPVLNVEGALKSERLNARGVDLNRNMATKDWDPTAHKPRYNPGPSANSESETLALIQYLESKKPSLIVSLHSWHPVLNVNGNCRAEAEVLSKLTGYKIEESIGYPTPGCLGTYAGLERNMPTITYEVERGSTVPVILKTHIPAIREMLKFTAEKK